MNQNNDLSSHIFTDHFDKENLREINFIFCCPIYMWYLTYTPSTCSLQSIESNVFGNVLDIAMLKRKGFTDKNRQFIFYVSPFGPTFTPAHVLLHTDTLLVEHSNRSSYLEMRSCRPGPWMSIICSLIASFLNSERDLHTS